MFHPKSILKRKTALCGLALAGLMLTGCGGESGGSTTDSNSQTSAARPGAIEADCAPLQGVFSELLARTNAARDSAGVPDLKFSFQLGQSAQAYAEDLATQDFFSHSGKDGSTYVSRIAETGYRSAGVGENLIAGYATAAQAIQGWLNSPTHKANLLHERFTEVGFGMFDATGDSTYGRYWVQHLGKPASGASSDDRAYIPQSCGLPVADTSVSNPLQAVAARSNLDPSPKPFDSKVLPKSTQSSNAVGALPVNALAMRVASLANQGAAGSAESVPEPAVAIGLAALGFLMVRSRKSL